ncbi:MAG: hypothetical protein JWP58_59 [Hymenobacter sp.]|nr:hypothetical protein [Hymenobacter sp.]
MGGNCTKARGAKARKRRQVRGVFKEAGSGYRA